MEKKMDSQYYKRIKVNSKNFNIKMVKKINQSNLKNLQITKILK